MTWSILLLTLGLIALLRNFSSLYQSFQCKRNVTEDLKMVNEKFYPKVSVIIPCKEIDPNFENNIIAILEQDYSDCDYIFVTESSTDPAYTALKNIFENFKDTPIKLVISSDAKNCSQKIQNQLRGFREVEKNTDVLVFADSDIQPHSNWLRNLIKPLENHSIGAATGYRWYMPMKGNFWSAVRSVWNMSGANVLFFENLNFAWGGSMAIRRKIFEDLDVAQKWQTGLSDDSILTNAVKESGRKIKFVPASLSATYETISWQSLIEWTTRQMTIVRIYMPKLWKYSAITQWVFDSIFLLGLIIVLKALIFQTAIPIAAWFLLSDLPFHALINAVRFFMFKNALAPYRDEIASQWWIYVTLHPVSSYVMNLSLIKSCLTKKITWRGIQYEMRSAGETVVVGD